MFEELQLLLLLLLLFFEGISVGVLGLGTLLLVLCLMQLEQSSAPGKCSHATSLSSKYGDKILLKQDFVLVYSIKAVSFRFSSVELQRATRATDNPGEEKRMHSDGLPSCTTSLLRVVLDRIGELVEQDETHGIEIDSQTKG